MDDDGGSSTTRSRTAERCGREALGGRRSSTRSRRSRTRAAGRFRRSAVAAIVELAREHDVPVLEDDPYGLVRFEGDAALAERHGVRAGGRRRRRLHVVVLEDRRARPARRATSSCRPPLARPGSRTGGASTYITPALLEAQATVYEFLSPRPPSSRTSSASADAALRAARRDARRRSSGRARRTARVEPASRAATSSGSTSAGDALDSSRRRPARVGARGRRDVRPRARDAVFLAGSPLRPAIVGSPPRSPSASSSPAEIERRAQCSPRERLCCRCAEGGYFIAVTSCESRMTRRAAKPSATQSRIRQISEIRPR